MGQIRIIGGRWRGRLINVVTYHELRPTPDRVRETLFNWLMGAVQGSRCLDLFAGSGGLGFEALSRGAQEVVLVDHYAPIVKALQRVATEFNSLEQCKIVQEDSLRWLKRVRQESPPFDIIFLDPPFGSSLVEQSLELLAGSSLIHPNTLIYVEASQCLSTEKIPAGWELIKQKTASEVVYHLLRGA